MGKICLISKVIDGKFPDYQKVVPKENNKTLTVSSSDFISSVERVASVSLDRKEGVKLELTSDKLKLSVNSTNSGMEMRLSQQNITGRSYYRLQF